MQLSILLASLPIFSLALAAPSLPSALFAGTHKYKTLRIHDPQGQRNVSYYVTDDGQAIIDGDIEIGPESDLISMAVPGGDGELNARAFSIFSGNGVWPGSTVRFKYSSDAVETQLQPTVNAAIGRWTSATACLRFAKVTPNSDADQAGVLTIRANNCAGCSASVGAAGANRRMNLQQACPGTGGVCGIAEAVHEFGHVLGLQHEAQRPDRENFVHFNCENLAPGCTLPAGTTCCDSGLPAGCCATASNFAILNGFDDGGNYDIGSIMQYRASAFAIPGTNTLTGVGGVVVPLNNPSAISATDTGRIESLYC